MGDVEGRGIRSFRCIRSASQKMLCFFGLLFWFVFKDWGRAHSKQSIGSVLLLESQCLPHFPAELGERVDHVSFALDKGTVHVGRWLVGLVIWLSGVCLSFSA